MSQKDADAGKLNLFSGKLLLVEGKDEVSLFSALIRRCIGDNSGIQVISVGGKDQFPRKLRAIGTKARARSLLSSIGVVRDADDDPQAAFESVRAQLHRAGYEPPDTHGIFFPVPNRRSVCSSCPTSRSPVLSKACAGDL